MRQDLASPNASKFNGAVANATFKGTGELMPIPLLLYAGNVAVGYGVRAVASQLATGIGRTILSDVISGTLTSMIPTDKDPQMAGANLPSVRGTLPAKVSPTAKAKPKPALSRSKLQKGKDVLIGLGLWELVSSVVEHAPDYLSDLWNGMDDGKITPEKLARLSRDDARQVVLVESAKLGVSLDASAGLTGEEALKYAALLRDFGHDLSKQHDNAQVVRPTTGDPVTDVAIMNNALNRAAARLGLTGVARFRQLYDIAMVFNSLLEKDIENAELHELQYGPMRLR